jgi:hypothetical protein
MPLHLAEEILPPILFGPCARSNTKHVSKPRSATLEPPQEVRVAFSLQIVIQEISRSEAFDIPLVKVFVAEKTDKVSISIIVTRH